MSCTFNAAVTCGILNGYSRNAFLCFQEYVFDEEVEAIWDKGDASGLVMYTDAVYWEKQRGDFDERQVDDWDVDATGEALKDM